MKYTWFSAVNYDGEWLTENGHASVEIKADMTFSAGLTSDSGTHIIIEGKMDTEGVIISASIMRYCKVFDESDILEYSGYRHVYEIHNKKHETIIFSNGQSIIGIAGGKSD